jgi:hypothetical protein
LLLNTSLWGDQADAIEDGNDAMNVPPVGSGWFLTNYLHR